MNYEICAEMGISKEDKTEKVAADEISVNFMQDSYRKYKKKKIIFITC